MTAALAGHIYGDVSGAWNWVVAAVCVVMGLHLAGVLKVPMPSLAGRVQPRTRGVLGALVLGALFGLVSAPCAAPILVVLLTYLAGRAPRSPMVASCCWCMASATACSFSLRNIYGSGPHSHRK